MFINRHIRTFFDKYLPRRLRSRISFGVDVVSILLSVVVIGAVIIDYGFTLDNKEMGYISKIYSAAYYFYMSLFTLRLIAKGFVIRHQRRFMTILIGVLLYLSLLPMFVNVETASHWLTLVSQFLENKYYIIFLLAVFALLELSRGIVNFIRKSTNPALLFATSFIAIIFIGTILLLVPRSTMADIRLPVVDALFISTSAVCVTGLTSVDISSTFTVEGQIIIMMLIQIGGLGVMTITSFFAMFFMGNVGFYNQFTLREMVGGSEKVASLFSTLLYIIGFTLMIELCGAALIYWSIHGTLGLTVKEELFFSLFHAVSSFCNAGFSTLAGNLGNPVIFGVSNSIYIIISFLVILGGIGFPILVNIRNVAMYHLRKLWNNLFNKNQHKVHYKHLATTNTRIVLIASAILLIGGTMFFAVLEWNGTFAGMSIGQKLTQAFFHSVMPRTVGFSSVDLTHMGFLSIICYIFLMWIGGGSQSTAGGIKVNVLAVAWASFIAAVRGTHRVVLFNREITDDSIRQAAAVIFGSILSIFFFFVVLVIMEPDIRPLYLLFEVVSAISTVGSSLNTTQLLCDGSKLLLSLAMFTGRIGLIYLLTSIIRSDGDKKYRLPKDNIIIN